MEFLKWTGAILLSIAALGLVGGVIATVLTISAIMAGLSIAMVIVYVVASGIKQRFFNPAP